MGKGACIPYMSIPNLRGRRGGQQAYAGRYGWVVGRTHSHSTLALETIYLFFLFPGYYLSFFLYLPTTLSHGSLARAATSRATASRYAG